MRHFTFLMLLVVAFASSAFAQSVEKATAETVAKNCYYQSMNKFDTPIKFNDVTISNVRLEKMGSTPIMYVVEFERGGFVLVSAQESSTPILGYSTEYGATFDINGGGPSFKYFIEELMASVEYAANNNIPQEERTASAWAEYTTSNPETLLATKDDVEIGPLLATLWNQDSPYNYYSPPISDGPGGRAHAGCVATAMSVVMHHFEWPLQGTGQSSYYSPAYGGTMTAYYGDSTYNWNAMPIELKASHPEASIFACALIQYHSGVSVRMQWGGNSTGGSGAFSTDVPYALNNYFGYSGVSQLQKLSMGTVAWENALRGQLDQGYPMYHSGTDPGPDGGGHAWNCDGYRVVGSTVTFHHNFNWGGYQNGWYASNNPNGFTTNQTIMQNFKPSSSNYPPYASGQKVLTSKYGRVGDGSGPLYKYLPNRDATWLISPQGEYDSIATIELTWEQFDIAASDNVSIYDGGTESAPLVGTYTGTTLPEFFKSSGNQILIKLHAAQSSATAAGFVFTYKSNYPQYCPGSIVQINSNSASGYSNPENKYYNPSTTCRWNIVYSHSTGGTLTLNYVDTYDEKDYCQVGDYETGQSQKYSGNVVNEVIPLSQKGCMITFSTDNMYTSGHGLHFTYIDNNQDAIGNIQMESISVYPNPAKNILNVKFESTEAQNVTVGVTDILGRVVYKDSFTHYDVTNHVIDVSSFNAGIYIVTVESKLGTETKKIVIE